MKTRKTVGAILAIIGIFAAICVKDGSAHELIIRGIGIAMFAIGAAIGKFFDFQNS